MFRKVQAPLSKTSIPRGPTFAIEYDNYQNNANHVHTVWRDFENDFAADLLRRHLEQEKDG